jgi:hypothetical protein
MVLLIVVTVHTLACLQHFVPSLNAFGLSSGHTFPKASTPKKGGGENSNNFIGKITLAIKSLPLWPRSRRWIAKSNTKSATSFILK